MVNIYLFLYQFFINGAGRCPPQPLNKLHFFSFPSIQVIRFILLFVFVFAFFFIQRNHFQPDIRKPNSIQYSVS